MRPRDGCNQGFGQSVGLLPIGDKKRKQIAASGGNESTGWGGSNQGIIGGVALGGVSQSVIELKLI